MLQKPGVVGRVQRAFLDFQPVSCRLASSWLSLEDSSDHVLCWVEMRRGMKRAWQHTVFTDQAPW